MRNDFLFIAVRFVEIGLYIYVGSRAWTLSKRDFHLRQYWDVVAMYCVLFAVLVRLLEVIDRLSEIRVFLPEASKLWLVRLRPYGEIVATGAFALAIFLLLFQGYMNKRRMKKLLESATTLMSKRDKQVGGGNDQSH